MKKILIMAGGTGGHVFPGLAVAKELTKNNEFEVLWLGTRERMEARLVPQHGFKIEFIKIKGLRRNGLLRKIVSPFLVARAVYEALGIIRKFKPDVVLGLGGYASGPGGIAAKILGIPLILHEQNASPGVTNRILSKFADVVLLGFPGALTGKRTEYVGNPVREDVLNLNKELPKNFDHENLNVLVIGGSLGAQALNENIPEAVAIANRYGAKINITHQTGQGNSACVTEVYKKLGVDHYTVTDFISDMASAYKKNDVIICRAGALTLAEVSAAGMPAIFVPLPTAVDDHQTKNARYLSDNGGAVCLPQSELTPEKLADILKDWSMNRNKIAQISQIAGKMAKLDATVCASEVCRKMAGMANDKRD